MILITIINGVYKPTYNWGAPHCIFDDGFLNPLEADTSSRSTTNFWEARLWLAKGVSVNVDLGVSVQPSDDYCLMASNFMLGYTTLPVNASSTFIILAK